MACAYDLHSGTEAQDLRCGNLGPKPEACGNLGEIPSGWAMKLADMGMRVSAGVLRADTYLYIYIYKYISIYISIYININKYIYIYKYTYICMCTDIYTIILHRAQVHNMGIPLGPKRPRARQAEAPVWFEPQEFP